MAKRDRELTLFEQAKTWWESDTAKAIATIVAVLLIPASVLAWNYATNRQPDISDEGASVVEGDQSNQGSNAATSEENKDQGTTGDNTKNDGQGSTMTEGNKTPSEVGGMGVATLPNTASTVSYVVQNGDSIYSISQTLCGNDSFYVKNMRKNYLKVGSTIEVGCE